MTLHGLTRPDTTYEVVLSPEIRDIHGQTLGSQVRRAFTVDKARPSLFTQAGSMCVLDPAGRPAATGGVVDSAAAVSSARPSIMPAIAPRIWGTHSSCHTMKWPAPASVRTSSRAEPPSASRMNATFP